MVGCLSTPSRLVMGTGGFRSLAVLEESLVASESTIATVALRRVDPSVEGSIYDLLTRLKVSLLPNTAGCYSAEEAVKTARLAREAFDTPAVKLEVIGDDTTLLPDTAETIAAATRLVAEGFEVWAYTSDDLVVAQRLEQVGCVAVMPLGSPIGSGLGIRNPARPRAHRRARLGARCCSTRGWARRRTPRWRWSSAVTVSSRRRPSTAPWTRSSWPGPCATRCARGSRRVARAVFHRV